MVAIAIVGLGKIALDQHVSAIHADGRFELVATADPNAGLDGVPSFASLSALLGAGLDVKAVALCTPPTVRQALAEEAIAAGLHVLLEKPPAATLSQAENLVALAEAAGVALFATWHSREAAGVGAAREWLTGRRILAGRIDWREDVAQWHPGQQWILAGGGHGVFDPGINALSILTAVLPVSRKRCSQATSGALVHGMS